jgi:hypothetical protein
MAKRGAPPGNRNAVKHGFYSRHFHRADLKDLEHLDSKGLVEEISLLRLHARRLTHFTLTATDVGEYLDTLRTLNLLISTINRLIKTQVFLAKEAPGLQEIFDKVLDEVAGEWNIEPASSTGSGEYNLEDFFRRAIAIQARKAGVDLPIAHVLDDDLGEDEFDENGFDGDELDSSEAVYTPI